RRRHVVLAARRARQDVRAISAGGRSGSAGSPYYAARPTTNDRGPTTNDRGPTTNDQRLTTSMLKLETQIDKNSTTFKANRDRMQQLVGELRARIATAKEGGGAKYLQRHREQGKMPVRERIDRLIDPGSPFLELSPLAAIDMYDDEAPAAGLITGIGRVSGREALLVANDATVKGGTYYPTTVKKHVRAQQIALENRLPCVYLVDSGGA